MGVGRQIYGWGVRPARDFFRPLAVGAPEPVREIPFPPSRMIHFFPAANEKMRSKVPDIARTVDILVPGQSGLCVEVVGNRHNNPRGHRPYVPAP